jgi:hypothetical protein
MVYMGMGEDYGVNFGDGDRESSVFCLGFTAFSLKHSAIERDCMAVHVQKVARARDLAGRACKRNLQVV